MHQSDYEGSRRELMKLLADNEMPPAFIERASRTQAAADQVLLRARRVRTELLEMAAMRLGFLAALIEHNWAVLRDHLADTSMPSYLETLYNEWNPQLRVAVAGSDSARRIRRTLKELASSFANFNRKWRQSLNQLDLTNVNDEREGYNNYYVLEKAAAFDSELLAREGFEELPPFTPDDVLNVLPYLRVPRLIGSDSK